MNEKIKKKRGHNKNMTKKCAKRKSKREKQKREKE